MNAPSRPVVRWFGGKWRLAPWIISFFGQHRVYVEPFGGGASVLLRKPRSYAEVYNDLDGEIVNMFRVLRSDRASELLRAVELTPFAREEFAASSFSANDDVERARQLLIRSFMGFGSNSHNSQRATGFRANSNRSGTTPAHDWRNYPEALAKVIDRLRGVVIENRHAIKVMAAHDTPATLHYVDPPYVHSTRKAVRDGYRHELTDADHAEILSFLGTLKGAVVLSGYRCDLYDDALAGWARFQRPAYADGAQPRTEHLWLNAAAAEAISAEKVLA